MQTHERYNGIFLPANSQFAGMLNISGGDSILKIVGTSFIADPEADALDIHGILSDGKKVSLIDCVLQRNTRYRLGENTQSESVYFPHYVVVGEEFISSSDPVICAVRYHFENVDRLLSGHKTFRSLLVDKDEVLQILEADHKHSEKIAKEHGWQRQPFEPELGEHPHLVYFSGLWEIVACQTEIGKISLTNRTSHGMGDATGIGIDNEVAANIEFSEPKTLNAAIHALQVLHGLFELSLGCRQRIRWIELELIHRSPETDSDMPSMVRCIGVCATITLRATQR
ncbi:ApeA N-terminal domain 1-containing protein [Achromobacter mucicolens]|uniref:ApeA N-terminal domain 1-containing protein n=1 Tax=Achromobacter mucicolens TaxID=1389922 RepID=UPI0028ABC7E7|nr:hypothetical protein [Achromobacter mucicolens]